MGRTYTEMSVATILAEANGSTDIAGEVDWYKILANKVSHDHFDWLVAKIADEGFTIPVVLLRSSDGYILSNGHHRICAAILLGLETIPVVITDNMWDWVEDSHDGNMEIGASTWDVFNALSAPGELLYEARDEADMYADAWRAQYVSDEDSDHDGCENCGGCASCCGGLCRNEECDECKHIVQNGDIEGHAIACAARDYEVLYCFECARNHFRCNACDDMRARWHADAIADHIVRGGLPAGAWHPAGVLADAYAEHADWLADEPLRIARAAYENEMEAFRIMRAGGGWLPTTAGLLRQARRVMDAERVWLAL